MITKPYGGDGDVEPVGKVRRSVTLQDVADRAGVSRAAASAVLNESHASARTSVATRERVIKAAADLAYRPNAIARSLRSQSIATVGFYNGFGFLDSRNAFVMSIMAGMHGRCDAVGCDLLFHRRSVAADVRNRFREIMSGKVDGVILYTNVEDPLVDLLVDSRFPSVALADYNPKVPSYIADDENGSRLLARRLAERGHKIALYRTPPSERASGTLRCGAFCDEATALGMQVRVSQTADQHGEVSAEEAAILDEPAATRPTAVANWNDLTAVLVFMHLHRQGRSSEFAIVGFDGFEQVGLPATLTTIRVNWEEVAEAAVDGVRSIITGTKPPMLNVIPGTLIDGTTG